jgi:hypothetical protein
MDQLSHAGKRFAAPIIELVDLGSDLGGHVGS